MQITLEATHHGPITTKPTMFIEIGIFMSISISSSQNICLFFLLRKIAFLFLILHLIGLLNFYLCWNFFKLLNTNTHLSFLLKSLRMHLDGWIWRRDFKSTQHVDWRIWGWISNPYPSFLGSHWLTGVEVGVIWNHSPKSLLQIITFNPNAP